MITLEAHIDRCSELQVNDSLDSVLGEQSRIKLGNEAIWTPSTGMEESR